MARKLFPDVSSFRTASPAGRYAARAGSVFALVLFTVAARGSFALAAASYSLQEADARLAVAQSLLEGGIYDQAKEIALSILNDDAFREPGNATHAEAVPWLQRREAARFTLERGRFGLAHDTEEYLDIAEEFAFLFQNRYRLPSPAYHLQSAYWAARAYQEAGDYDRAVAMYSRVGGFNLPPGMEGDAARRTSECLREMAEALPYPGDHQDRQLRNRLLDQAIDELGRARNAMAVGRERKELELDLISLRLARREPDYLREALAEAEAFMTAEAARDALRARAALYRAMASERLGDAEDAITWFRAVVNDENPDAEDRRTAEMGLALALRELSENRQGDERTAVLRESVQAFQRALADAGDDARFDRARTILALTLLDLGQPSVALEAINPILRRGDPGPSVRYAAGRAELARGRPEEA